MKKIFAIVVLVLVMGGFVFYLYSRDGVKEVRGAVQVGGAVLIGSRTSPTGFFATSTVGVQFLTNSATSTYIATTSNAEIATFRIKALAASTSAQGPNAFFSFFGSSDYDCATLRTTAATNTVLKKDINWYDIGANQLSLAGSATISGASSTKSWIPAVGLGEAITFTNLGYECLRVDVSASGTQLFMDSIWKSTY